MYEQLFNIGPYPCLVATPDGDILAVNDPAAARLDLADDAAPASLFALFSDPGGRLREDFRRASASSEWCSSSAEIARGGLSGLRVQLSLRGLSDNRDDAPSQVLVWIRDDATSAFGEHTDLIRRLNREIARQAEMKAAMESALARQAYLHGELIHRVKNNLTVLAGLIRMRMDDHDDPQTRGTLQAIELRTRSIALVHDLLDRNNTLEVVNADDLIGELCKLMSQSMIPDGVTLNCEVDSLTLHNEDATVLCLLINELVTNSVKHAFPRSESGSINLHFRRNGVERMELRIADDGAGAAPHAPEPDQSGTRGTRIVHALAQQINGELVQKSSGGMEWTLIFHPRQPSVAAAE